MDKRNLRQLLDALTAADPTDGSDLGPRVQRLQEKAEQRQERLERELAQTNELADVLSILTDRIAQGAFDEALQREVGAYLQSWVDGQPAEPPVLSVGEPEATAVDEAAEPVVVAEETPMVSATAPEVSEPMANDAEEPVSTDLIDNDPELIEAFAVEATEHLEAIEALMLDGEPAAEDRETIDALFRAFHTIKGNSSFFGFTHIQALAHDMETILDQVRSGEQAFTSRLHFCKRTS